MVKCGTQLRSHGLDLSRTGFELTQFALDCNAQIIAFARPIFIEVACARGPGSQQFALETGAELARFTTILHYARQAEERGQIGLGIQPEVDACLPESVQIAAQQFAVITPRTRILSIRGEPDTNLHVTSRQLAFQQRTNAVFKRREFSTKVEVQVEPPVIDAT